MEYTQDDFAITDIEAVDLRDIRDDILDGEEFKYVHSLFRLYQVSNMGRVKRLGPWGKILNLHKDAKGFLKFHARIGYFEDAKYKTVYLHRAIAEAWLENPMGFNRVKFLDGNKENCKVDNLEWY